MRGVFAGELCFHLSCSMLVDDFLNPSSSTYGISEMKKCTRNTNSPGLCLLKPFIFPQQRRPHRPAVALGRGKPYLPRTLPCCPVTCPGRTVVGMWIPAQLANWGSGGSPPVRWDKAWRAVADSGATVLTKTCRACLHLAVADSPIRSRLRPSRFAL